MESLKVEQIFSLIREAAMVFRLGANGANLSPFVSIIRLKKGEKTDVMGIQERNL